MAHSLSKNVFDFGYSTFIRAVDAIFMIHYKTMGYKIEAPYYQKNAPFIDMINSAENHIQMTEYLDLHSSSKFISALGEANDRGVRIDIFHPPYDRNPSQELSDLLGRTGVHTYPMEDIGPKHFMVVDGKHMGLEDDHPFDELSKYALLKYNTREVAYNASIQFNSLKQSLI